KFSVGFQLGQLPECSFGSVPREVGSGHWRERFRTDALLEIGRTQVLDKHAKGPAVGDGVVNREYHQLVIGGAAKDFHSIKRTPKQIERLGESFQRQLFYLLGWEPRRNIAKSDHRFRALSNQLHRPVFSRQERKPQHVLPIDDALDGRDTILRRNRSPNIYDTTNMI